MNRPDSNAPVQVKARIKSATYCRAAMNVIPQLIDQRRPKAFARYLGPIPGCGGDVWLCVHLDGTRAAYLDTELEWYATTPPKEDTNEIKIQYR